MERTDCTRSGVVDAELSLRGRKNLPFTARERDILATFTSGFASNSDIADQLGISKSTVKNHLRLIFIKTGMGSRVELLFWLQAHPESLMMQTEPSQAAGEIHANYPTQ